jgi:anti-sigma-K factor RskA
MDWSRPDRAEALAAQYVAGTLRGRARRRFEDLLPAHPQLQAAVRGWQERLLPLAGVVPPQAPPARVWQAIERRLWPVAPASAAAPQRWWQRVAAWRGATAVATLAAVALLLPQLMPQLVPPAPGQPPVIVVLQATGAGLPGSLVASVGGDGRSLVLQPLQQVSVQQDRVLELWSVPPEGAPKSLGLISASGTTVLARDRLPPTLLKGGTAALAVSVEPPGGSPTGAPTGPVVFAGKLQI